MALIFTLFMFFVGANGDAVEDINRVVTGRGLQHYWILHEPLICATLWDLEMLGVGSEYVANVALRHTDRVNNLIEPHGLLGRRKRDTEHTPPLSVVHSILVFKGRWYDRMPTEERIYNVIPNHVKACSATILNDEPQGNSTCMSEHADLFTSAYRELYGTYTLTGNNCHYFTNRLASFLTEYQCGKYGLPSGHCTDDQDTYTCKELATKLRERLCHITYYWTLRKTPKNMKDDPNEVAKRQRKRTECLRMAKSLLTTTEV